MRVKKLFLIGMFLLLMISVSQAQEVEQTGQGQDLLAMPIIKSLFYGFDILDIGRGLEGKIAIELSGTFTSKHMLCGMDMLDDHGAFLPVGTIIFGDSGFTTKIIDVYPLSGGFERSVERNYAGFYTGDLLEGTPWATSFSLNYFYFGKPKIPGHKNDAQEIGSTFYWPRLFALGDGYITPRYYVGHFGASKSNSNIRGCEGFIHVFGLGYDFEIPEFWPGGDKQAFRLSGDITYNDGYASSAIDHDWSHAVLNITTNVTKGKLTITPSLSYQISMEDTVNPEDELWSSINVTYRF